MVDIEDPLQIYRHNSILLPDHYKESKELYELFLPGGGVAPPSGAPLSLIEQRFPRGVVVAEEDIARWQQTPTPLFYDVFAVAGRPFILAFGRDLVRLRKILGELKIYSGDKQIAYARSSEYGTKIVEPLLWLVIELDAPLEKPMELSFHWPSFSQTVTVEPNPWQSQAPLETLVTLQKDNAVEWISDWCLYYHRLHNIDRIVIYNNKGLIEPELQQLAASLDKGLRVHFVVWPFLFDWDSCSQRVATSSCCVGMLNHCYWWLADRAKLFLNFDIDEYLVNASGKTLADFLSSRSNKENRGAYLWGYDVPSIDLGGKLPRLRDHRFRARNLTWESQKMFYAPLCWGHLSNHRMQSNRDASHPVRKVLAKDLLANKQGFSLVKNKMLYYADYWSWWWWEFSAAFGTLTRRRHHLKQAYGKRPSRVELLVRGYGRKMREIRGLEAPASAPPQVEVEFKVKNVPLRLRKLSMAARCSPSSGDVPELYFLHCRGLNTRWNAIRADETAPMASVSATLYVEDPFLQRSLRRIGLDK